MLKVLLIDDDQDNLELFKCAMALVRLDLNLQAATDGEEALDYLRNTLRDDPARLPDLILLDLNLPRKNGREFLADLLPVPQFAARPVVILSTTDNYSDLIEKYPSLKNQAFTKPMSFQGYVELLDNLYQRSQRGELKGLDTEVFA